jgi:hypothetical protein
MHVRSITATSGSTSQHDLEHPGPGTAILYAIEQALEIGFQLGLGRRRDSQARASVEQTVQMVLPQTGARRKNGDGLEQTIAVVQPAIRRRNQPLRIAIDQDSLNSGPSTGINR